jgi:hypothetical protein
MGDHLREMMYRRATQLRVELNEEVVRKAFKTADVIGRGIAR